MFSPPGILSVLIRVSETTVQAEASVRAVGCPPDYAPLPNFQSMLPDNAASEQFRRRVAKGPLRGQEAAAAAAAAAAAFAAAAHDGSDCDTLQK